MGSVPPATEEQRTLGIRLQRLADRLGLRPGEATELLERLPFGAVQDGSTPEAWHRPIARQTLEAYAARKRAIARLARCGRL